LGGERVEDGHRERQVVRFLDEFLFNNENLVVKDLFAVHILDEDVEDFAAAVPVVVPREVGGDDCIDFEAVSSDGLD